ncbi:hypothetical protein GCM10023163_00280 [Aestuariibaculum suncheonense]
MLLGASFYGFSQDVKFGVRGGYNISNLDFKDTPFMENKHRNSFYFGAFSDIAFSKGFSLVPEIQFSAEGAKDETLNLDYIQMPIFLKFRLAEKIHFGVAPQVGIKVHKEEDMMKNFAYSGVAGLQYKISYTLFADVRYTYGFSNVFDDDINAEAKNTNIQIGIGYKF